MKKKNKTYQKERGYSGPPIQKIVEDVISVAEPFLESEDFELVNVECVTENRNRIIRVYIDKEGGVTLDDCVHISRELSDLLDANNDYTTTHALEVSSPGFERPLVKERDFIRFKGERIKVKTTSPISGRSNFTGVLLNFDNNDIVLRIDGEEHRIPFHQIKKAHITSGEDIC